MAKLKAENTILRQLNEELWDKVNKQSYAEITINTKRPQKWVLNLIVKKMNKEDKHNVYELVTPYLAKETDTQVKKLLINKCMN